MFHHGGIVGAWAPIARRWSPALARLGMACWAVAVAAPVAVAFWGLRLSLPVPLPMELVAVPALLAAGILRLHRGPVLPSRIHATCRPRPARSRRRRGAGRTHGDDLQAGRTHVVPRVVLVAAVPAENRMASSVVTKSVIERMLHSEVHRPVAIRRRSAGPKSRARFHRLGVARPRPWRRLGTESRSGQGRHGGGVPGAPRR